MKRSKAYYVINTIQSLIKNMKDSEKDENVIVIFIADQDQGYVNKVVTDVQQTFPNDVKNGLIQVIVSNPNFYPNLSVLPGLYGDKPDRVKWRSKQSLDYSFLYYYCMNMGEYFVQLEDDIITVPGYIMKMKEFIKLHQNHKWSVLEFGARGFIGMTYRNKHLGSLSKFVRSFFWIMPVDLLFRHYNDIYLYKNPKNFTFKPPIFKHVGAFSSLDGQTRKLEDLLPVLDRKRRFQTDGGNPAGKINTTIALHYNSHTIELPYSKSGIFWGKSLKNGYSVKIAFKDEQTIKQIVFSSGVPGRPTDRFGKTQLEIARTNCENYEIVKEFDSAIVDHVFTKPLDKVACVKIVLKEVTTSNGIANWLILEEIAILN